MRSSSPLRQLTRTGRSRWMRRGSGRAGMLAESNDRLARILKGGAGDRIAQIEAAVLKAFELATKRKTGFFPSGWPICWKRTVWALQICRGSPETRDTREGS